MKKNVNNQFLWLFLAFMVFGVVLYSFMNKYTDELLILLLVIVGIIHRKASYFFKSAHSLYNVFSLFLIFGFYITYSLYIQSNQTPAILLDAIIEIKPYLAFITTLLIAPALSDKQKAIIKKTILCCFAYCAAVIVYGIVTHANIIDDTLVVFFINHAGFATCTTALTLCYLYVSKRTKKDVFWSIAMLSLGLFSARSKFYGFFTMFLFFTLIYKGVELKIKVKNIVMLCLLFFIVFFVAQEKFHGYFVEGMKEDAARPLLYVTAVEILTTHIPFGSGLGSFATYASGEYYSPLYYKFHLNTIHGLDIDTSSSIYFSDTFFPVILAEFGIVGMFLFVYFWYSILKKAAIYKKHIAQKFVWEYLFVILIFFFFMIESIAATTFTLNSGILVMILLGMCVTDLRRKVNLIKN
jgi:hypothetical protein